MSASTAGREPVLDGIRGIAILTVLLHHFILFSGMALDVPFDDGLFRFGSSAWLGVDLFFVLSGFLITGILYDAKSSANFFRNFYGRRILRIFPLYYGFLIVALIIVPLFVNVETASRITTGQGWYWAYLSNDLVALNGWQKPQYLGHFWSLAVEEQFYLVWPLVVFAFDRRRLLEISVGCFLTAIVLRFLMPDWMPSIASYVLLPTRMDALAMGAFVALVIRGESGQRALDSWPLPVLIGCLASILAVGVWQGALNELDPLIRTIGFAVIAVGFGALIAVALTAGPESPLRRTLSSAWLGTLAKYSYGAYVFHQPIATLLREFGLNAGILPRIWGSQLPGLIVFASVAALLTGVCAYGSWHLWESRFLSLKRYLPLNEPVKLQSRPLIASRLPGA